MRAHPVERALRSYQESEGQGGPLLQAHLHYPRLPKKTVEFLYVCIPLCAGMLYWICYWTMIVVRICVSTHKGNWDICAPTIIALRFTLMVDLIPCKRNILMYMNNRKIEGTICVKRWAVIYNTAILNEFTWSLMVMYWSASSTQRVVGRIQDLRVALRAAIWRESQRRRGLTNRLIYGRLFFLKSELS